MPNVIARPRTLENGRTLTQFTDTTSTSTVTYTYPTQQTSLQIENSGEKDITVTVGSYTQTVKADTKWKVDTSFTSFTISSVVNSQEFIATTFIEATYGTVKQVNGAIPDANGNVTIPIPQVDTSTLATKTEVQAVTSGSPKGTYATLSALQTAYPTGTTGVYLVTADGNWYYWNGSAWTAGGTYQSTGIPKNTVSIEKTTFIQNFGNLYNKDTVTSSYLQNSSTPSSNASYDLSDYIAVVANASYTLDLGVRVVAFFDDNKNYISNLYNDYTGQFQSITFTPTQNGFVRLTFYKANTSNACLITGTVAQSNLTYGLKIPYLLATQLLGQIVGKQNIQNGAVDFAQTTFFTQGKNLFNADTRTIGYYVESNSGLLTQNASYDTSDYIPVTASTTYAISPFRKLALYDANKTNISSGGIDNSSGTSSTITPTQNGYIRVSWDVSTQLPSAQVEAGSSPTSYESFSMKISKLGYMDKSVRMQHLEQSVQNALSGVSPLTGKTILNLGDSIAYGANNNGTGYADLIATNYGMSVYDQSVGGATIGKVTGNPSVPSCIQDQLTTFNSNNPSVTPDYILLEGGTNDILYAPLGTQSSGYSDSWDTTTCLGGLETICNTLKNTYPSSKILFVTVHNMSSRDMALQKNYHEAIIGVLNKWSVPVVDLYKEGGLNTWNNNMKTLYTDTGTHPTATAYNLFYVPLIAAKMKAL